ncbi:MAG: efflux RND transporter permease subunit, partial [Desulfatitalea sp.]|nr:efflux RND transporter permease subunit [Desulfatitalea sp.]NNK02851.1 efflux RND transporter permease subunit [Desulfatitalea sp.]
VLVTVVLWLCLGFRNAMLTAIGIPFAFLCTLIIMLFTGVTINTISIFSFVLVTGIIVDDAVIIVENAFRHMQMGKTPRQAIIDGTSEVMLPVISSALTTMLAFIPMLIMTGSTGDFFATIPKTVSYALVASLFEALFILPIHILDWGPKYAANIDASATDEETPFAHLQSGIFAYLWRYYERTVTWILDHKVAAFSLLTIVFVSASTLLLVSMFGIAPLIKIKFFPGNYFRYHITLENRPNVSLERTDQIVRDLSRHIMSLGGGQAQSASAYAGFYEDQDYVMHHGSNLGQVVITLPEKDKRDFPDNPRNDPMRHLSYMRAHIEKYMATTYARDPAQPRVQVFEESDGPPTGKAVNIRIQAETMQRAMQASQQLLAYMRSDAELSDLVNLGDNRPTTYQTVKFEPRQEAAFAYNLSTKQITGLVAGVLYGYYAGPYRAADDEVDLLVRLARADDPINPGYAGLRNPMDALAVPVIEDSAAPIYLRDLVSARYVQEPNVRYRYEGKPAISISADIRPGASLSPAMVQKRMQAYVERSTDRLQGVSVTFGGEFESTEKSYTSLAIAFCLALLGIYLVLATQFRDYFQPLLVLAAVPFSIIGVSYGVFLTRTIFTVGSFIATVGLAGVAVNDTILLIEFMNKRVREGQPLRQSVLEACAARMRPVLITTVTTLLGLLPMAIGIPSKSISWAPMATAFVTGLLSATLLTLLITPANYEMLSRLRAFFQRQRLKRLRRWNTEEMKN